MNIMGYNVFTDELKCINSILLREEKIIINTINPHSYVTAKSDHIFKKALIDSNVLVPDGSGIVLAAKILNGRSIKKIAGFDVHKFLLEKAEKESLKVFYMGSSWDTLNKIKTRLEKNYPNVKAGFYSPPFKPEFDEKDNQKIINKINSFSPDILFVGMTAPKQEKWLYLHKEKIDFKIASCIGAVFDFYAGNVKRPSELIINMHLEWLFRFFQEPKRLWKRNFISTPLFLKDMISFKYL